MLTIKEPIGLITRAGMTALTGAFDERIRGNYGLMAANFTPKELLYLLVNAPETPVPGDSLTSITVDHRTENRQEILLEVVNNIVNRVLLSDNSQTTYQDRVYVDMALRKLGIENTALFFSQTKRLREETLQLFREYKGVERRRETERNTLERYAAPGRTRGEGAASEALAAEVGSAELYLHERIYERLQTADVYRLMRAFASERSSVSTVLDRRELLLSEQSKAAEWMTVEREHRRQDVIREPELTHLETRTWLEEPAAMPPEGSALESVAAAAALAQTVNNVLNLRAAHYAGGENLWVDIRQSVEHTAQNALSRLLMAYEEQRFDTAVTNLAVTRASETSYYGEAPVSMTERREETLLREILPQTVSQTRSERFSERTDAVSAFEKERIETVSDGGALSAPEAAPPAETLVRAEREIHTERGETELLEALTQIDRQNRERVEKITEAAAKAPSFQKPGAPDRKRTMRDALRALETPELVLAEAAERMEAFRAPEGGLERILERADSSTRYLVEQLRLLEKDPKAAEALGVRRGADPSALNSQVTRIEREKTELIQRIRTEEAEELAALAAAPRRERGAAPGAGPRGPAAPGGMRYEYETLPFVHKTVERTGVDELVRQLQQQKTEQVTQTETHTVSEHSRVEQTQVNEAKRELVNKTAEDVTELVNKTLMRQIGTISDKVYTQLEKRLQSEKARRGRM